jgi:hypothetical protein
VTKGRSHICQRAFHSRRADDTAGWLRLLTPTSTFSRRTSSKILPPNTTKRVAIYFISVSPPFHRFLGNSDTLLTEHLMRDLRTNRDVDIRHLGAYQPQSKTIHQKQKHRAPSHILNDSRVVRRVDFGELSEQAGGKCSMNNKRWQQEQREGKSTSGMVPSHIPTATHHLAHHTLLSPAHPTPWLHQSLLFPPAWPRQPGPMEAGVFPYQSRELLGLLWRTRCSASAVRCSLEKRISQGDI